MDSFDFNASISLNYASQSVGHALGRVSEWYKAELVIYITSRDVGSNPTVGKFSHASVASDEKFTRDAFTPNALRLTQQGALRPYVGISIMG